LAHLMDSKMVNVSVRMNGQKHKYCTRYDKQFWILLLRPDRENHDAKLLKQQVLEKRSELKELELCFPLSHLGFSPLKLLPKMTKGWH
jgi:hypothetical protein